MAGDCLIQGQFAYGKSFGQTKIWSHMTGLLIQGVAKAVLTVYEGKG